MKNILDNPQLPTSKEWYDATLDTGSSHPLLEQFPDLKTVLDYGRWAPSGDNMQPWRFKLLDAFHFDIHGFDTRKHCVYDLQGHASQLSLGMLLENLSLGAAVVGQQLKYLLDDSSDPENPIIHVHLSVADVQQQNDLRAKVVLASQVILRSVHRQPLSRQKISSEHKVALEQAVSPLKIVWFEGRDIYKTTRLFYDAAGLRLRIPEGFATHSSIMEWQKNFSRDKMPVNTLGASWPARKLMRFALKDWKRVNFLNTYLAGTLLPRLELDVIPGLFSGAHFILLNNKVNESVADFLQVGQRVQRFWLTAVSLGIQLQPQMTPLIFANYNRMSINFTVDQEQLREAEKLADTLSGLIQGENVGNGVFIGRLGYGEGADSRSTRLGIDDILVD